MASGKLVSVIVPVYNAVSTLERCINSILLQSYRNLEIIMVDDASTDSSRELMLKLEQKDTERIVVVCNDVNHGAGGARNIALEYARGDYLAFVDSDDYIHSSFVELLVTEMERGGHDFVDCGYYDEREDKAILHTDRNMRGVLSDETKCEMIAVGGYLCTKLFKRELFYDHNVRFREKCILEDSEILVQMIAFAKSVGAVEETMYWYTASPSSTSNGQAAASYVKNVYEAMNAFAGLREKIENYEALRPAIEYIIIQLYDYGVYKIIEDMRNERAMDALQELGRLRELRLKKVTHGYDNKHILARIPKIDLEIMALNDKDPQKIIKEYGVR